MRIKIDKKFLKTLDHRTNNPDLVDMFGNSIIGEYFQGWEAAEQYAYDVIKGYIITNKHIKNAAKRFVNDLQRNDLRVDKEEIELALSFANSLCHVKGPLSGKPIMLLSWIIFLIYNIYGFYYTAGEAAGERRFQKAFVLVGRGNAKSFIASFLGLYETLISENGQPMTMSAARTRDQASIVLKDAMAMAKSASGNIKKMFKVSANKIETKATDGIFIAASSDADTLDGKRIQCGIIDELHAHVDSSVYNVVRTGIGSNKDPIMISISTAGRNMDGICYQLTTYLREVVAGITEDDRYFAVEYSIDDTDEYDDIEAYIKANPSLGHSVNLTTLKSTLKESAISITQRNDFIIKHCNRFIEGAENAFIDIMELKECSTELDIEDYVGRDCYIGIDLARRTDLCSLVYAFPNEDGGVDVFSTNYLPKGVLKRVRPAVAEKYLQWEDEGSLVLTEGESTDLRDLMDEILAANKDFNVMAVAYDPANSNELVNKMEGEGVLMVDVRQGFGLSEPAKLIDILIKEKKLKYDSNDRVFEWCCSNAVFTEGRYGDIAIHKPKNRNEAKIDTLIALLVAMKLVVLSVDETSVYEDRGFIELG